MKANIQIIENNAQEKFALVPMAEWERVSALAEDAGDILAADQAMRELAAGDDELVPLAVARMLLEGKHPLHVWRRYRGLTQQALADAAGMGKSYISQIESGAKTGSVKCLTALAAALRVSVDDLILDKSD